jgi:hypothetical protein
LAAAFFGDAFAATVLATGFFAAAFLVAAFIAIACALAALAGRGPVVVSSVLTCKTPY